MSFPNLLYRISYSTIFRSSNIFFHCKMNMPKSAIIFLLGFMVILLPFGPSNLSNANAIAEDENYVNQYENYAMDMENNNYYKSKISSNVKCNNMNVNANGFNGAKLPTGLSGLATDEAQAADEGEGGTNSFGSDSGSDVG